MSLWLAIIPVVGAGLTLFVLLFGNNVVLRIRDAWSKARTSPTLRPNSERKTISRIDSYRVGVFPYPPLNFKEGEGFEGPWARLIYGLADDLSFRVKLELLNVSKFRDASKVEVDIVIGLFATEKRREAFDFSIPVHRVGLQGVCLKTHPPVTVRSLSSGNVRILVQGGEVGWEFAQQYFRKAEENHNLQPFDTLMTYDVHQYIEKGFDVAITDEASCVRFLKEHAEGHKYRLAFTKPLNTYDACVAIKKSLRINMSEVNKALERIRNDPAFRQYEIKMLEGYEEAIEPYGVFE